MSIVTGIAAIGIPVRDQDRALGFYGRLLGLETHVDAPMPNGGRWIMLAPRGGAPATMIALVRATDDRPAGVETGVRFTTSDVQTAHDELRSLGVDADEVLRWPGVPAMFSFRDRTGTGSS